MKRGEIFFIIGPTAAGKTVIVNYILKHRTKTTRAISHTTREKRPDETNGKAYFFVTEKEFNKILLGGRFIENTEVYGNLYGTTEESFKPTEEGFDVIKIIDYQGAKKFKDHGIKANYIFFAPKDIEILKKRLKERGDIDIEKRLEVYKEELKFKDQCDYFIDTSGSTERDIEKCAKKVITLMDKIKNKSTKK